MDIDHIIKIGALVIALIPAFKPVGEWLYSRKEHLRDEYKFASEFFGKMNEGSEMHPFLKQKGYQVIANDSRLNTSEIEYLLTLRDPAQALRNYSLGRSCLKQSCTEKDVQIAFLPKYKSPWLRIFWRSLYFTTYMVFSMGALLPIYFSGFPSIQSDQAALQLVVTSLVLSPPAFWALRANLRLTRAETLVSNQQIHTRDTPPSMLL